MNKCLVLGVNGQAGSFLAELLAARGRHASGLGRQPASRYVPEGEFFHYFQCDLRNQDRLTEVLENVNPGEIYHVAAVHGPAGFSYEMLWGDVLDVNVKSLHTVLEYSRRQNRDIRIFYASSGKVFGNVLKGNINLTSPKRHDCLYSVSKLAAENLLDYYRKEHGLFAVIAYLFNNESVRRPSNYFIPKLMAILNSAIKREDTKDQVYTLDFFCDWGCAREYMEMAMALLHAKAPKDVIFATGKTWYGRDFVRELFALYGLDYRDYLSEALPELDSVHFHVDIAETSAHLGRVPVRDIFDICHDFISPPGFLGGLSPHSLITEQEL